ncbi:hypothetical protein PSTG_18204, partial [Puccinia striiformis f. sp. tritici PST-78]
PRLFPSLSGVADTPPTLDAWLRIREGAWAEARDSLWTSRIKQAIQHNRRHRDRAPLTPGCWVLLDSSDWRGRHQGGTDKLKERFEGPYKVLRVFNHNQNVELELPDGDRRHPSLHVSKVKLYHAPEEEAPKDCLEVSPIPLVCTASVTTP